MAFRSWCLLLCLLPGSAQRVAVVGAGLGGTSAAHYLRELLGDQLQLVLYEASGEVGGRTLTRTWANLTLDVGGTAIYSKNRYVSGFAKRFGLQRAGDDGTNNLIGIWDGERMRIELDMSSELRTGARALLRYGLSPLRVIPKVRDTVSSFDSIYEMQDAGKSFETPQQMLEALEVFDLTQVSAYTYFRKLKVAERFTKELIDGASRCNYNQDGGVNGFTDLISLAGAGVAGHVFGLQNGTQGLSERLALAADQVRLKERVREVRAAPGGYVVVTEASEERFEGVILAAPLEMASIRLPGAVVNRTGHGRSYQTTYVTFVHGQLNRSYFGRDVGAVPAQLFTPEDSTAPFSSFSIHKIFPDRSVVVKLFSRSELSSDALGKLFGVVYDTFRYTWKAYPKLQPMAPERWASFRLSKGLLYTSGLESGASAMEIAAIAGRNAALLMQEDLRQNLGREVQFI